MNLMEIKSFSSFDDLTEGVADLLATHFQLESAEPHAVMLSGGRTPLATYQALARRTLHPSPTLHVLYSDERMVNLDSPENNARNALPLIETLGLSEERHLRVPSEQSLDVAANAYDEVLTNFLQSGRVTLGLLGIGADGHTASLFNREDVERGTERYAIAVARGKGPDRVSVTPRFLRQIERIVFLVSGKDKKEVLETLLNQPASIPAGLAVRDANHVEIWAAV